MYIDCKHPILYYLDFKDVLGGKSKIKKIVLQYLCSPMSMFWQSKIIEGNKILLGITGKYIDEIRIHENT